MNMNTFTQAFEMVQNNIQIAYDFNKSTAESVVAQVEDAVAQGASLANEYQNSILSAKTLQDVASANESYAKSSTKAFQKTAEQAKSFMIQRGKEAKKMVEGLAA